ncbi:MAG: type II toxin-antitoxin system ParD family antitoxin [Isosphaeraceae bacterium]
MTVHIPEYLERFVHDQVQAGRYSTEDEVISDALEQLRQQVQPEAVSRGSLGTVPDAEDEPRGAVEPAMPLPGRKPLWERAAELRKSIPEEEWAKLPVDGAEQLDHYLYGSPKRPTS